MRSDDTDAATESPVADAARRDDIDAVRTLIADGADVNAPHGDGMTGLHWAALNGNREIAQLLIDAGAALAAATRLGAHTPLHVAAKVGHGEVVAILAEAGADPAAVTETGATPLHFAAASGDARSVTVLLGHGAAMDAREPQWGQTPLMFAAALGRTEAVTALLEAGADGTATAHVMDLVERDIVDRASQRRRSVEIAALREGREPPPDPPPPAHPPPDPHTPDTSRAAQARDAAREALETQLRTGEPIPLNYAGLVGRHGGLSAIHLAAREGHAATVAALLDGSVPIDLPSAADNTTPMLVAAINGHFDLVAELLARGADPNAASDAGATPLYAVLNVHWAPKARHPQPLEHEQQATGYLELMQALLDADAEVNARLRHTLWFTTYNRDLLGVDRAGATPFWRAVHATDVPAMKLLLEYGADPDLPTIKVSERRGGNGDTPDPSGLPPVSIGGPAVHPIHAAAGVGYGQGFAGNSHRHAPEGWMPTMRFLVEELGADVNARDLNGYTPVHHAAARGDNEMILYLVEKGADVTAVARNGRTTADMANGPVQRIQPFPETVALLERLGAKNNHRCVSC
ncbi:MAG: ankyrin repeat domain-containing protein [Gemmatimonadota bacterium]|nr:ankyrin repeat domain-containing protein [Gemmatimonadota bacterium]